MTNSMTLPAMIGSNLPEQAPKGPMRLVKALGPGRILALGAVALATLGFFGFLILRATEPDYTILFGDLDSGAAGLIVGKLDAIGVAHRLSSDGRTILVPENDVTRLRMDLAQDGLPAAGPSGYELLDNANAFTSTDLLTNLNLRRALEGELARTIAALHGVASARVHLVQPKRELFEQDRQKPTASVFLKLRGNAGLEPRQIQGIRQLVASAVPGLVADRITIVDDQGNLLARAKEASGSGVDESELEDQRAGYENRLRQKVLNLLQPSVGIGRIEVEVHADMDFDDETTTSETFDPERAVPRSTQTVDEKTERNESDTAQGTSVANNLPTQQAQPSDGTKSGEKTTRAEETKNYEIAKTITNHTKRGPMVKRLTIAVQVDGVATTSPDGKVVSQPRSDAEMAQLAALVKTATGFNEQRGDVVEIVSRSFEPTGIFAADEPAPSFMDRIDIGRSLEMLGMGLFTLLLVFFGLRPIARELAKAATPETPALAPDLAEGALPAPDDGDEPLLAVSADEGAGDSVPGLIEPETLDAIEHGARTDLPQIVGAVRSKLISDTNRMIAERPADAVQVIRSWFGG